MNDRLQLIQHLYGEDTDDPNFSYRLIEDNDLHREYEQLRETKERLDRRPSQKPDPSVVDRVVEEARTAARETVPAPEPDTDRSARSPHRTMSRRLQGASAALALVLVIGVGWWQGSTSEGPGTEGPPAGAQSSSQQQATVSSTEPRSAETRELPAWDDSEEMVRIHRRIERLQARSSLDAWEGLQTVGQSRP